MPMLKIQQFLKQHPDWEKLLVEKPYCIQISRDEMFGKHLVMFKYNQIDSDFTNGLVKECRGLVLDEDSFEPICVPYFKFFNAGEPDAADIDWSTAKISTKIDGSLIKIVRIGKDLLISTNGTIDADKAPVAEQIGCNFKSFGELVRHVIARKEEHRFSTSLFKEGYTYMFELISPYTRVVIPYNTIDLYFHGVRNNKTFEETCFDQHELKEWFKTPDLFPLKSIDECFAATKEMPWDEEGYVVCDANFNRIKVKSPSYVAAHNLRGNGIMSYSRAIELVRSNEIEEICAYFEDFRPALEECKTRFWDMVKNTQDAWEEYQKIDASLPTRKDKAIWITKNFPIPGIAFGLLDKKIESVKSFFMNVPTDKLVRMLGYKE